MLIFLPSPSSTAIGLPELVISPPIFSLAVGLNLFSPVSFLHVVFAKLTDPGVPAVFANTDGMGRTLDGIFLP